MKTTFKDYYNSVRLDESEKSDEYEKAVADNINKIAEKMGIEGLHAERPATSTAYSDVLCTYNGKEAWIEVKMNHTDNLSNPRFYYENSKWASTYKTPVAQVCVDILNSSKDAGQFIKDLAKYIGGNPKKLSLFSTKTGLKRPNAVQLNDLYNFCEDRGSRYILEEENYDIGELARAHYGLGENGKAKANYIQTGDDFYRLSTKNPLKFVNVPLLKGSGDLKIRIATRPGSGYYEIMAEVKLKKIDTESKYSFMPGSTKPPPIKL